MTNFRNSNVDLYMRSQYCQSNKLFDHWIDSRFPQISDSDRNRLRQAVWTCQINDFVFLTIPEGHQNAGRPVAADTKFANLIPKLWDLGLKTLSWEWFGNQNAFCFEYKTTDNVWTSQKLHQVFGFHLANLSCYENGACYWYFNDTELQQISNLLGVKPDPNPKVILATP